MNKLCVQDEATKILVVMTGGLITEKLSDKEVVEINCREILDLIDPDIDLETLELIEFSSIDSSSINLEFLHNLATFLQRKVNSQNVKGLVILHGTDTLEVTAYFLHRCIYSHGKPIVLTGSMRMVMDNFNLLEKA